jgi:hypothetical protein
MGLHGGKIGRYFFGGWVDQGFDNDYNFHIFEVIHEGLNESADPLAYVWNDAIPGNNNQGSPNASNNTWFTPLNISLGAWTRQNAQVEFSNAQVGELLFLEGEIEETDRLLIEGYLAHKWGIALPSSHPWNAEGPTFGEIVTKGATPVGFTGSTSGPIAINLGTANLRQSTASLTGQLINPGRGILKPGEFSPNDYPGLELWLDTSAENGVDYDPTQVPDPIPWNPSVVQEVVFHLDANDSSGITLSDQDVAEWRDKSGNGYDMVAQGHPKLAEYGYGTGLKVVHFESAAQSKSDKKAGGDALYSEKKWDTSTGDFTMFAVARYAADEEEWYKNNFVISSRSKNSWAMGFGYQRIGYTFLGGPVSTRDRETHTINLSNGSITNGEVFSITHGGATATYSATSDDITEGMNGIVSAINSEFFDTFYSSRNGSTIFVYTREYESSESISVSANLTISKDPPTGVFIESANDAFHLIAVDVDGSADTANVWLDLSNITQYQQGSNTVNDNHFPKYLQFGGSGTFSGYSTCEIGEFIAFNKVLSEEERQKVEGYLGHRWSNSISFPPDHTYSEGSPDWSPSDEASLQAWFDANDSTTINTNYVKKWKDSINGNEFAQSKLLNRPAYIEDGLNGLSVIDFDGDEDSLFIDSRFGLKKNPDLSVYAVSITDSFRVSLNNDENNVSASLGYSETRGPEYLLDQDLSTYYLHPDGNQSSLIFDLPYDGRMTAISFTSSVNEDRFGDPAEVVIQGLEDNGSYHLISELVIPSFDSPKQSQLFAFENDRNFSTYIITFLNNQDDFNNSKQIELAEIELFGVPESDQWLSTAPIFHLGGQANTRIISTGTRKLAI